MRRIATIALTSMFCVLHCIAFAQTPQFPDGWSGDAVTARIISGASGYDVPSGRTLYILSAHNRSASARSIQAWDRPYYQLGPHQSVSFSCPLVFMEGSHVEAMAPGGIEVTGIEVDSSVEIVNIHITGTSRLRVDKGETLYIFTAYNWNTTGNDVILANWARICFKLEPAQSISFSSPLVIRGPAIVASARNRKSLGISITGYIE